MSKRQIELRTMPYDEYLKTPEWIAIRDQALERDGHRCRVCDSGKELNVHHRTYARRGDEDLNDLTTLCHSCHEYFHRRMSQTEIMQKTYAPPPKPHNRDEGIQRWEDYLLGLFIYHPDLHPQANVILTEDDFFRGDSREVYRLLQDAYQSNSSYPPFEDFIPTELQPIIARSMKSVELMGFVEDDQVARECIDCIVKIKRMRFLRENEELKTLLQDAADAGDTDMLRQHKQRLLFIYQQLRVLNNAVQGRQ